MIPKHVEFLYIFILMSIKISCSAELSMKKFITSGPDFTAGQHSGDSVLTGNQLHC